MPAFLLLLAGLAFSGRDMYAQTASATRYTLDSCYVYARDNYPMICAGQLSDDQAV